MLERIGCLKDLYAARGRVNSLTRDHFGKEWEAAATWNLGRSEMLDLSALQGKLKGSPAVIVAAGEIPSWVSDLDATLLVCSRALEKGFPRADYVFAYDNANRKVSERCPLITSTTMDPEFVDQYEGPVYWHENHPAVKTGAFRYLAAGGNVSTQMLGVALLVLQADPIIFAGHSFCYDTSGKDVADLLRRNDSCFRFRGRPWMTSESYNFFKRWTEIHVERASAGGIKTVPPTRHIKIADDTWFGYNTEGQAVPRETDPVGGFEHLTREEIEVCLRRGRAPIRRQPVSRP